MSEKRLSEIRCYLLDMDGTIYLGNQLLPGAREFLDLLAARGIDYYFLTNNSSRSRVEYQQKMRWLGLDLPETQFFTSGEATAIYLAKQKPGARLYVVGTPALEREFQAHGFELVTESPDFAVLGFDTTLTYEKIWRLCDLVRARTPFIATHPDINCPTETGFMPDIGAMLALVKASTGREPDVIVGKPYRPIVEALVEKTGYPADQVCMVGDRLYTDIALGQWGFTTVLVLSGETSLEDLEGADYRPDFVMENLAELVERLRQGPLPFSHH